MLVVMHGSYRFSRCRLTSSFVILRCQNAGTGVSSPLGYNGIQLKNSIQNCSRPSFPEFSKVASVEPKTQQ